MGLQAAPIVLLITFLIGCIIAQQGFFHFRKFGAESYVVDMVGVLISREIGVLLVTIMVAGRSGSSYTAELGSMKMREEIDALRTMGLDPVEVLILPRVFALILAVPALTFLGLMAALLGGGLVAWGYDGMSPDIFIARLHDAVTVTHFEVGMIKAPFMALVVGVIACTEGLRVKGSSELLGTADDNIGGEIDLHRHRLGRSFRDLLRQHRDVTMSTSAEAAISIRDLTVGFGNAVILNGLSLDVYRGEILGVAGGSGAGKSVLMRTVIGLVPKRRGTIEVFGTDRDKASDRQFRAVQRRWGILFQQGALFSSLTARQNVQFPMREYLKLPERLMDEIATAKLEMTGLKAADGDKFPAELSGGMTKRVALARALALDPELVFLDEPTSGLDPISAAEFDDLILTLKRTLGLTVFMVTHDLDSLYRACDRVAAVADGKVAAEGHGRDAALFRSPLGEILLSRPARRGLSRGAHANIRG